MDTKITRLLGIALTVLSFSAFADEAATDSAAPAAAATTPVTDNAAPVTTETPAATEQPAEATPAPATDAPAPEADKKDPFTMSTNAFLDQGALPVLYTCDGKDISPQLSWTNTPGNAKAFALVLSDKDVPDGTFYHWVVFNMPKNINNLPEAMKNAPAGAAIGTNSYQKQEYSGPCPPKGSAHTYFFKLYALDDKISVPKNADAAAVLKAMEKHIVGETELSVVYSRWINS